MFALSRCLERRRKPNPLQPNEQTTSHRATETSLGTSSDHSDSTKVTSERQPKRLQNFESAMGTPINLKKSTRKKSYCSSIKSVSCGRFSQFCQSSTSAEPTQIMNDSWLSVDSGWATPRLKSKKVSGALNLEIKTTEFDFNSSLAIHEENEEPLSARRHSYSDDPFAPPTPRGAVYTPSRNRDSAAESDITRDSVFTTRAPPGQTDMGEAYLDSPILIPLQEPRLPTIARVSKLSFDWILELPKVPVYPHPRLRLPSIPRGSPMINYQTTMGTRVMDTPRTLNNYTHSPSRIGDQDQLVPFPEYP